MPNPARRGPARRSHGTAATGVSRPQLSVLHSEGRQMATRRFDRLKAPSLSRGSRSQPRSRAGARSWRSARIEESFVSSAASVSSCRFGHRRQHGKAPASFPWLPSVQRVGCHRETRQTRENRWSIFAFSRALLWPFPVLTTGETDGTDGQNPSALFEHSVATMPIPEPLAGARSHGRDLGSWRSGWIGESFGSSAASACSCGISCRRPSRFSRAVDSCELAGLVLLCFLRCLL